MSIMQRFWHSFLGPRPQLTSCRYPTSPCHTCWRTSGPSWSKSSLDWCTLSQLQLFLKQLSCCVRYEYDPKHIMTIIIFGTQLWTNSFNLEHPGFSLLLNFSHLKTESSNFWTDNRINKPLHCSSLQLQKIYLRYGKINQFPTDMKLFSCTNW